MMWIGIGILCILLISYLLGIKLQLKSIQKQLEQRLHNQSNIPVSLEFQEKALRDLTITLNETLKKEEELRVSQEIQEREFRDMITNISHDLRTPLTVMKGYLQLLENCDMDEKGREYLEIMFRHGTELEKRIQQFFEYSYWINEPQEVSLHFVNVTNLVTDTITDFIPVFEEKGITVELEDEKIQKGWGNEELIRRVLQNLLKNCLQYAPKETPVLIKICTDEEGPQQNKVRVSVTNVLEEDSHIAIDRVFDRFYVGVEARNRSTGLGLSIVKILVEKMHGEVFAEKEGNTFCIGFLIPEKNVML